MKSFILQRIEATVFKTSCSKEWNKISSCVVCCYFMTTREISYKNSSRYRTWSFTILRGQFTLNHYRHFWTRKYASELCMQELIETVIMISLLKFYELFTCQLIFLSTQETPHAFTRLKWHKTMLRILKVPAVFPGASKVYITINFYSKQFPKWSISAKLQRNTHPCLTIYRPPLLAALHLASQPSPSSTEKPYYLTLPCTRPPTLMLRQKLEMNRPLRARIKLNQLQNHASSNPIYTASQWNFIARLKRRW